MTLHSLVHGIRHGNRASLARAITLIESQHPPHRQLAQQLLQQLLPYTGHSIRVGITGVPGVGKSTFIEALGVMLCQQGKQVAVLAVDPSSSTSGGSILGDKTRMAQLALQPNAYIRPSPTAGTLGGVAQRSRETLLLCEAAGFDVVLVETVGVGQSETLVRNMVDCFVLLMLAGAGDELQGIKKGIMELADFLLVNKADGANLPAAKRALADCRQALRLLPNPTPGWSPQATLCSALQGQGMAAFWQGIETFQQRTTANGHWASRRIEQGLSWLEEDLVQGLKQRFFAHHPNQSRYRQAQAQIRAGQLLPWQAVAQLLNGDDPPNA